MGIDAWKDPRTRCFGMLLDGRARPTALRQRGQEAALLLIINDHFEECCFCLPAVAGGTTWTFILETNSEESGTGDYAVGDQYEVPARTLLLLEMENVEKQKK